MNHQQPTTLAILGDNPVVSQALNLLLRGSGYDTRLIEANPAGLADGPIDGTDLLLLASPTALASPYLVNPKPVHALVLTLSTTIGEVLDDESCTLLVPWPSPVAVLEQQIEAILHSGTKARWFYRRHVPLR